MAKSYHAETIFQTDSKHMVYATLDCELNIATK